MASLLRHCTLITGLPAPVISPIHVPEEVPYMPEPSIDRAEVSSVPSTINLQHRNVPVSAHPHAISAHPNAIRNLVVHEQKGAGLREGRRVRQIGEVAPRAGGERVRARGRGRGKVVAEEQIRRRINLLASEGERAVQEPSCTVSICTFSVGALAPQLAACVTLSGVLRVATVAALDKVTCRPLARVGAQAGVQIVKLVSHRNLVRDLPCGGMCSLSAPPR